jgi:hypothetical protein
MATSLGYCPETGRPLTAEQAPNEWIYCWHCRKARIRRRISVGRVIHYTTYRGDEHTHPVCASAGTEQKQLEFNEICATFHGAMLRKSQPGSNSSGAGGHMPPNDGGEIVTEKLTSLSGLVKWGLWECPDFQLNKTDRLSDIVLNSEIAPAFFTSDPYANPIEFLGFRAVVAKPVEVNSRSMRFRFVLNYKNIATGADTCMYFDMLTTLDSRFEEIRDKLFRWDTVEGKYVPKKYDAVLIYGEWTGRGCRWCNNRNFRTAFPGDPLCSKVMYEALYIEKKFIYTK